MNKINDLFILLDSLIDKRAKHEKIMLILIPIILSLFISFNFLISNINEKNYILKEKILQQKMLKSKLESMQDELHLNTNNEELLKKFKLLNGLKTYAITNNNLIKKLKPLAKNITTNPLTIYAVGDVFLLEELLEIIENERFVFIKNLNIKSNFLNELEIQIECENLGENLL